MEILYLHGWGSCFDSASEKIQVLGELGRVSGPDLDYTRGFQSALDQCYDMVYDVDYDLVVGTSLGGYLASHLGAKTGLPFVSINPSIDPALSLRKYLGRGVDHYNKAYNLQESVIQDLPKFNMNGFGLILLDRGDELLDSEETAEFIGDKYSIVMFEGGNHRFTHMKESLNHIRNLVSHAQHVYGLFTD